MQLKSAAGYPILWGENRFGTKSMWRSPRVVFRKRWYDHDPKVSEAIWAWKDFGKPIQLIVADYVNDYIQEKRRQVRLSGSVETVFDLPRERILGLYLSGQKRRWYDHDPKIRRAINSLALLPAIELNQVALQILEIKDYLLEQAMGEYDLSEGETINVIGSVLELKRRDWKDQY